MILGSGSSSGNSNQNNSSITLPAGAVPVTDESGKVQGYALGDCLYDLSGTKVGDTKTVQSMMNSSSSGLPAQDMFGAKVNNTDNFSSTRQMGETSNVITADIVPSNIEVAPVVVATPEKNLAIIGEAMEAVNAQVVQTKAGRLENAPLVIDMGVENKGIFTTQLFSDDTLPDFNMDLNALLSTLEDTDWPEYATSPAVEFQFNDSGALVVPATGDTRGLIQPNQLAPIGIPLAYRVVNSVVNTLIGSSRLTSYGTTNAYYRTYQFDKSTTGFVILPRSAGTVTDYAVGANAAVVFDGVNATGRTLTPSSNTSPSVADDFNANAEFLVFGGNNVNIRVSPYIPTRLEALAFSNLIRMGADGATVARAIALCAYQLAK